MVLIVPLKNHELLLNNFFVISDDDKHDQYFTYQVQKLIADYFSSISYNVHTTHEFTTGAVVNIKADIALVI